MRAAHGGRGLEDAPRVCLGALVYSHADAILGPIRSDLPRGRYRRGSSDVRVWTRLFRSGHALQRLHCECQLEQHRPEAPQRRRNVDTGSRHAEISSGSRHACVALALVSPPSASAERQNSRERERADTTLVSTAAISPVTFKIATTGCALDVHFKKAYEYLLVS